MKASFIDLRKKSGEVIQALHRNERVTVLYRGKPAAVMHPIGEGAVEQDKSAKDHPAFGLWADREDMQDPSAHVRDLRQGRFHAL